MSKSEIRVASCDSIAVGNTKYPYPTDLIASWIAAYWLFRSRNGTGLESGLTVQVPTLCITRAGLPDTIALGGTSRVTTLPGPTIAPAPIVTLQRITAPDPIETPSDVRRNDLLVLLRSEAPLGGRNAR